MMSEGKPLWAGPATGTNVCATCHVVIEATSYEYETPDGSVYHFNCIPSVIDRMRQDRRQAS